MKRVLLATVLVLAMSCRSTQDYQEASGDQRPKETANPSVGPIEGSPEVTKEVGAVALPAAGTYDYITRPEDNSEAERSKAFTVTFSPPESVRKDTTRQTVDRIHKKDLVQRQTWLWRADGLYFESESWIFSGDESAPCVFHPPLLLLKLPLRVGDSFKDSQECGDEKTTMRRGFEVEVVSLEEITMVDSTRVETHVIRELENIEGRGLRGEVSSVSSTTERTYWFSAAHGLRIRSRLTSPGSRSVEEELQSLTPTTQTRR